MNVLDEFVPFSLFAFLTGTLVYAFREFYIVLLNTFKFEDGRTGYMNYGLWDEGQSTKNPSANLVKAVLEQLDTRVLNKNAKDGQVGLLEIGCGLGQSAVDAVNFLGRFLSRVCSKIITHLKSSRIECQRQRREHLQGARRYRQQARRFLWPFTQDHPPPPRRHKDRHPQGCAILRSVLLRGFCRDPR